MTVGRCGAARASRCPSKCERRPPAASALLADASVPEREKAHVWLAPMSEAERSEGKQGGEADPTYRLAVPFEKPTPSVAAKTPPLRPA
jgi:hypothetical protein